jgi:GT2 family glycosyltransferase
VKATLIIINYNGRTLLAQSVPAALEAARQAGPGHAVVVSDDASTDGSVDFVRERFPEARLLANPKGGFGAACNRAVAAAETEVALILNNDVVVTPDFLPPLLEDLAQPEVFAVGCKFLNPDGSLTHALGNRTSGRWHEGLLYLHHETDPARLTETCPQLYPNGGGMAFWCEKWRQLGGFDPLYRPLYWEDADIGYRAWGRGWRVLYEPRSIVYHDQGSTMGRLHRPWRIELMSAKNAVLFAWKNLLDRKLFCRTLADQAKWAMDDVLIGGLPGRTRALLVAARQLRQAARGRRQEQRERVLSDDEILAAARGEGGR